MPCNSSDRSVLGAETRPWALGFGNCFLGGTLGAFSPWHILLIVAVGFLIFGVGGSKKLFKRAGGRIKETGQGIKGAAAELQAGFNDEVDEDSKAFRAARAGREKAAAGAAVAVDAAKEARAEIANLTDDARGAARGEEPETAIGRAARAVSDTARDVRAGALGDEAEHDPQTLLGKAAKSVSETAKARVDMLGETAAGFREGLDGVTPVEPAPPVAEAPALPPAEPTAPPTDQR